MSQPSTIARRLMPNSVDNVDDLDRRRRWRRQLRAAMAGVMLTILVLLRHDATHLIGRGTTSHLRRQLSVFGTDDRRVVSDATLYPYSAVGLLRWNNEQLCTATLVGKRFAVTAAECVLTEDGTERKSVKPEFSVGFGNTDRLTRAEELPKGASAGLQTSKVIKVHKQSDFWKKWTQETYAIVELADPLGETHGTLSLPSLTDLDQSIGSTLVQMVGFDEGAKQTTTSAKLKFAKCTCYFPSSFDGPQYMFHHDCDTSTVGSPGSPLLVRYANMETYIIGIHTNEIGDDRPATAARMATFPEFSHENANRGVLGPFIQKHLQELEQSPESDPTDSPESSTTGSAPSSSVGSTSYEASGSGAVGPEVENQGSTDTPDKSTGDGSSTVQGNTTPKDSLSPSIAYAAIVFVACAWAVIIFIALKQIRSRR